MVINGGSLEWGFPTLIISCKQFKYEFNRYTSNQIYKSNSKQGRNLFDVNLKVIIAFHEIGKGHEAIKDFSRIMSMPCMNKNPFNNAMKKLSKAYHSAALQSMKNAVNKVKNSSTNKRATGEALIKVPIDGIWQK